jgi:hypothetical protein|tara:strand:+ start:751 stop:1113 length:363 start_codon:yes stop_codon:yes gene_type:complete
MLKDTKKKDEEEDVKPKLNKGVELMLQRKEASSPKKFNLKQFIQGSNVLAIALTFGTLVAVLFLCVGGIIGWLYKEHNQRSIMPEMHPEMYDLKGNLIPDEIIAFRFENVNFDNETEDEL